MGRLGEGLRHTAATLQVVQETRKALNEAHAAFGKKHPDNTAATLARGRELANSSLWVTLPGNDYATLTREPFTSEESALAGHASSVILAELYHNAALRYSRGERPEDPTISDRVVAGQIQRRAQTNKSLMLST